MSILKTVFIFALVLLAVASVRSMHIQTGISARGQLGREMTTYDTNGQGSAPYLDEVIENNAKLHDYLELALHYAQKNEVAVRQYKGMDEGVYPAEAVEAIELGTTSSRSRFAPGTRAKCQKVFCGGIGR